MAYDRGSVVVSTLTGDLGTLGSIPGARNPILHTSLFSIYRFINMYTKQLILLSALLAVAVSQTPHGKDTSVCTTIPPSSVSKSPSRLLTLKDLLAE